MLNRRIQIQKYTKALRKKHGVHSLKNHLLLKHQLDRKQQNDKEVKVEELASNQIQLQEQIEQNQEESEIDEEQGCWNDEDGEQLMADNSSNKLRKLTKTMRDPSNLTVSKYQKKLNKFYSNKFQKINWAKTDEQNIETVQEKDVADHLNEEILYAGQRKINHSKNKSIKFVAKTPVKHSSIITGLEWQKNIMFTCGYDKKLFVYHYDREGYINEEKIKLQKEIYVKDLPLSRCYYHNGQIIMGSLHKNLVIIDTHKWQPTYITSNFLKQLQNYQNLRVYKSQTTASNRKCALFKKNNICLLDKNNVYTGSLISNDDVLDFTFSNSDPHYMYSITSDAVYEWDSRKMQVSGMMKQYLNFTSIEQTHNGNLIVGSKLGGVYIYSISNSFRNNTKIQAIENNNLLTDVSNISCSQSGDLAVVLSKWKSNAARVISVNNGRAIKNWPAPNTKIGLGMASRWSTNYNQDWFSIGNANGQAQIYEISDSQ